jgi:hypothetical protein
MRRNRLYTLMAAIVILFAAMNGCKKSDDTSALVETDDVIEGLSEHIAQLSEAQKLPVAFPQLIPKDEARAHYYASSEVFTKDGVSSGYIISIGYTNDCNGVHVCTIGYVRANKDGEPELFKDRDNNDITESVMLADNIQGYFTPGHAMGSYFPPMLQWQQDDVLFTISWEDKFVNKDALKAMANSVIFSKE